MVSCTASPKHKSCLCKVLNTLLIIPKNDDSLILALTNGVNTPNSLSDGFRSVLIPNSKFRFILLWFQFINIERFNPVHLVGSSIQESIQESFSPLGRFVSATTYAGGTGKSTGKARVGYDWPSN